MKKFLSATFLILGLFLISQGFVDLAKRQGIVTAQEDIVSPPLNTEEPLLIFLPKVNISLPIYPTEIKDRKWPTTESGVSYIKDSGKLGISGNLVMYGHNWKKLLGSLKHSKVGDTLSIFSNQNKNHFYVIKYVATVDAKDISILADTSAERITLYTCTGLFDSQRFVVVAERVKG